MLKFNIVTLGCKVNQCESESMSKDLEENGWGIGTDNVDLCIINTCTVTGKASMQSRQEIRKIIKKNPNARIIVTGCYAQTEADEIKKIKGVDLIVGHGDKHKITGNILLPDLCSLLEPSINKQIGHSNGSLINRQIDDLPDKSANSHVNSQAGFSVDYPAVLSDNYRCTKAKFQEYIPSVKGKRTRPFLKIQDGCNAFCTYCIIPYARGRSCSMLPEQVVANIKKLSVSGYHEVVLTGIHIGCYGNDLTPAISLFDLFKKINNNYHLLSSNVVENQNLHNKALCKEIYKEKLIDRIRLSSIEPMELTDEIIELFALSEYLCNHFHIPLQSGDNHILKRMCRPYTREIFKQKILKINQLIPDAAIGIDVLIGFPGETEEQFLNTYSLLENLPITYLHVFPFSKRKNTPAAEYKDQIHPKIIKERCSRIRELGQKKKSRFYKNCLGKKYVILVENKRDRVTGLLKGVSSNYINVLVSGNNSLKNSLCSVRLKNISDSGSVFGVIEEPVMVS